MDLYKEKEYIIDDTFDTFLICSGLDRNQKYPDIKKQYKKFMEFIFKEYDGVYQIFYDIYEDELQKVDELMADGEIGLSELEDEEYISNVINPLARGE